MSMEYKIAAHPTRYKAVLFRSRLEARWAAFFDLVGLTWEYEPIDLAGWTPDFHLGGLWCSHSECVWHNDDPIDHDLYIEVKPARSRVDTATGAFSRFGPCPCTAGHG